MFIESIRPQGFLSFDPDSPAVSLRPLNVFIGANGAGKSNLIDAVRFLQIVSRLKPIAYLVRNGSRVGDWIWKGAENQIASVEAIVRRDDSNKLPLRYRLAFRENRFRFEVTDERLEEEKTSNPSATKPRFFIGHEPAGIYVNRHEGGKRTLKKESVDPEGSVLSVYDAPEDYPENAWMVEALSQIEFFTDPLFGRSSEIRKAQSVSLSRTRLEENGTNLALVFNRVVQGRFMRERFTELVREVYPKVESVEADVAEGTIQIIFDEGTWKTRAPRLSDGTMRWVFLLTLLLDPDNGGPIFLDEPDLGLHPDALSSLADLLREVSARRQLVVATHNVAFIDQFTETPEVVVAFDRASADKPTDVFATRFHRLDPGVLSSGMLLGEAWQRGLLGGVRW